MKDQVIKLPERSILEVRTSRTGEESAESMVQFLSNLTNVKTRFFYFWKRGVPISLEMAVIEQRVHMFVSVPRKYQAFIESQLVSQYPKALMVPSKDYLPNLMTPRSTLSLGQLKLTHGVYYPLRTFRDFKDVDPLSSVLGVLSKAQVEDKVCIQFLLVPVNNAWQSTGDSLATKKQTDATGASQTNPYAKFIQEKIALHGFKTAIRIAVNSPTKERSWHYMHEIANSFSAFSYPGANSLSLKYLYMWQSDRLMNVMQKRSKYFMPTGQILNVAEIASMFHFPTKKLENIHNIAWHKTILSDPPEALPIAEGMGDEEKQTVNFFARTEFKNKQMIFGLKQADRRRHVYIIGKTGSGKSTLIANMAINDMRNKRGFCIIDPHGDLCELVLNFVPSFRVNDVVYLDPSDHEYAFSLNPLEVQHEYQRELVVSGIVGIFHKLYGTSWGPRLEYILRNALLSVISMPNPTLMMVTDVLTNDSFRRKVVENLTDPVLKNYWINEFDTMPAKLKAESLSPILNKVGQFTSSTLIRNIIKSPKSTIDLEKIMNEGKILLLNLSQGKLGEDNAALLGAMTITKIQLAAMNRVTIEESQRRDFYLYVDEFQNFATSSFIKILSEARKYRLNLILANQYIAQIPEDVRAAIFGNAGTMLCFLIGAADAGYMAKEFGERFKEEDLLALGNYQSIIKLAIDNVTQSPFLCYTLPLPRSITQNKEKVINSSRQRYMKPVKKDVIAGKNEGGEISSENTDVQTPTQTQPVQTKVQQTPIQKGGEKPQENKPIQQNKPGSPKPHHNKPTGNQDRPHSGGQKPHPTVQSKPVQEKNVSPLPKQSQVLLDKTEKKEPQVQQVQNQPDIDEEDVKPEDETTSEE